MELGRDADTGGQIKYVVELAKALGTHENIAQVDLFTRIVEDQSVSGTLNIMFCIFSMSNAFSYQRLKATWKKSCIKSDHRVMPRRRLPGPSRKNIPQPFHHELNGNGDQNHTEYP